jgi:hypothetical protein
VRDDWTEFDRVRVAEVLMRQFPDVSIDKLLAAIRECDHQVKPSEGRAKLVECTRVCLEATQGTGPSKC